MRNLAPIVDPADVATWGHAQRLRDADHTIYSLDGNPTGIYRAIARDGTAVETSGADALKSLLDVIKASGVHIALAEGTFDLGTWTTTGQKFNFVDLNDWTLSGSGMDKTVLQNSSDLADDTEPVNCTRCNRVTIRDLTVNAGGSDRGSSDALDFDDGDNIVIERVKVTGSRGSGIAFDGKDSGADSSGHTIRDCIIDGAGHEGILFWAVTDSLVDNVSIRNCGGGATAAAGGIKLNRHSGGHCHRNTIRGGVIESNTGDGIMLYAGSDNVVDGTVVQNNTADGILIATFSDGYVGSGHKVQNVRAVGNGGWGVILNPNAAAAITSCEVESLRGSGNTSGLLSDGADLTVINGRVELTQAEYDAITPDPNTLYVVVPA